MVGEEAGESSDDVALVEATRAPVSDTGVAESTEAESAECGAGRGSREPATAAGATGDAFTVAPPINDALRILNEQLVDPVVFPPLPDESIWDLYPVRRGQLRKVLASGRAVVLRVSSGSLTVAELNKLWHWVDKPSDADARAGVTRIVTIDYASRENMHVHHELFREEREPSKGVD